MMQNQGSAAQREAPPASDAASAPDDNSPERFFSRFDRVPSGLDPGQVYNHFITSISRIKQLEDQASRVSAPFLIESALRDASEIRTQASQTVERAYNSIVKAAEEEAERLREQAQESAGEIIEQARAAVGEAQREADQVLARAGTEREQLLAQAQVEAEEIRQQAQSSMVEAEQELERLCVDFAGFLQRILDRREARAAAETPPASTSETPEPTSIVEPPAHEPIPLPATSAEPAAGEPIPFAARPVDPPAAPEPTRFAAAAVPASPAEPPSSAPPASPTSTVWTARPASTDQPAPVAMPAAAVTSPSPVASGPSESAHQLESEPRSASPSPRPFVAAAFERARDESVSEPPTRASEPSSEASHQDQPAVATVPDQPTPPATPEKKESGGFKLPSWLDL